jgi:hypothetical protein
MFGDYEDKEESTVLYGCDGEPRALCTLREFKKRRIIMDKSATLPNPPSHRENPLTC